jgi:hypothetical protein
MGSNWSSLTAFTRSALNFSNLKRDFFNLQEREEIKNPAVHDFKSRDIGTD